MCVMRGFFIWFGIWGVSFGPKAHRKAVAEGRALPRNMKFVRLAGVLLIAVGIVSIASALTGVIGD